jgi:asparagine synthase (glutamine-hydrolysing)
MSWIFIKSNDKLKNPTRFNEKRLEINGANFIDLFNNRFKDDKVLFHENGKLIAVDGIILNKLELLKANEYKSWEEWCSKQCWPFCEKLRGPFNGCCYDEHSGDFFAYGNQTGDSPIFYYCVEDTLIVSPDFNAIYDFLRLNNVEITFNERAANQMLSLGFLVDGNTFITEIHKVFPGNMLVMKGNKLNETPYHRFHKETKKINEEEAIEIVEKYMTQAVHRCFDKDVEYGFTNHLVDMSGGLDSRVVNYAKSDSIEYNYARNVSCKLGNDFIFKQLDDLNFFYDIDESIDKLYGLTYYFGMTGGSRMLRGLNFNYFGLEHTGQLGDSVIGAFHCDDGKFSLESTGNTSGIIKPQVNISINDFDDGEICYAYYTRMFNCTLISHLVRRHYTYTVSPFMDVDLIQQCINIPIDYRKDHKLYFDWIYAKHPHIVDEPCTTKDGRRNPPPKNIRHLVGKMVGKRRDEFIAIIKKISGVDLEFRKDNTMNPFDYWYNNNPKLRKFMEDYYKDNCSRLIPYPKTKSDIENVFYNGNCMEKGCVLTILAALKHYMP